ncbi:MAG: 4-(cytidine 5'-diphospho)-2-C-methyl-D-erythritol kinase [Oscillospiraceae bacterium]|nr:4-(cytidine 5'-diphospho)-2-C-methyl-D-erythritol kinase [Oscillospiraceae bacterium]
MLLRSYAKINLSLDILRKREDGYHEVDMIMQTIDLYDIIELMPTDDSDIIIRCNKKYVPNDNRNTAYKAAEHFFNVFDIHKGVNIVIKKNIPVSAGMAGGSSNAAAVYRGLRSMFKPEVNNDELRELSVKTGSDVPFCISGGTAICRGIGEKITNIKSFKDKILVVVKPNFGVSTTEIYKRFDMSKIFKHPDNRILKQAIERDNLPLVCREMRNLLENVTIGMHPKIKEIKKELLSFGSLGSMMTGSGPTVFGFFDDMLTAQRAFVKMRSKFDEVFITRTM